MMGRFKIRHKSRSPRKKSEDSLLNRETTDDSWKFLDYTGPTSKSDSDSDKIADVYAEVPSILGRSNRATSASGISDVMPLEHTRYSVDTTDITVTREALEEEWGARFVENNVRVGNSSLRSLIIADLSDYGIMENAGLKCGDIVIKINSEDVAMWTHEEILEELELHLSLKLTVVTNKQQQTKYLLFIDLSPGDLTNLWALNNLVSLNICSTKLKNGFVDLRYVSCKGVLQELAVTKSELTSLGSIRGLEKFTNLRTLNLNHNKLSNLDNIISKLTRLVDLRLGDNCIDKFPVVLTELQSLRSLSLVHNLISTIPEHIIQMRYLENLHLDDNYLSEVPEFVIQQLPSLVSFTFSNNVLAWDESNIRECFHIDLIDFTGNGVRAKTGLDSFGVVGRETLRRNKHGKMKEQSLLRKALVH